MDYQSIACGVDLGGTKIVVALVTQTGEVLAQEIIRDHRDRSEDQIVDQIADSIHRLVPEPNAISRLAGTGVGTSGHVDYRSGIIISNSNLPGFDHYPLADRMSKVLGTAVTVDNDANAQTFAEYRFGAGRGFDNVVFVTVSTGLGSGIVIDGKLYRGVTGTAGEIGHTIVKPDSTVQCGCGNFGCLMAHTSGLTLPDVVAEKLAKPGVRTDIDFALLPRHSINGELIKAGLDAGDELCTEVVMEYAHFLGIGLHNLVQTLNPGVIVLGGGLTSWGPVYLDHIRESFHKLASKTIHDVPEVRLSALGADAAVIGAAALAMTAIEGSS